MAGGDGQRFVGTLHLLLLATVLSLIAGSGSPGTTAWTQEKVRGLCSVLYFSGSWRATRPGTWPPPPGLAGGGSGKLSPCPGVQSPPRTLDPGLSFPSLSFRGGLGAALEAPGGWVMSPSSLWPRSDGGADRRRKSVSLAVEELAWGHHRPLATLEASDPRAPGAPGCLD
ncbi:hypothetical protein NN561_018154 [Cricetulus griseus]